MPVTCTNLTAGATTGNISSMSSASITLVANSLATVWLFSSPSTPNVTVTGLGATWTLETRVTDTARSFALYSSQIAASTGPGALDFTTAGTTWTGLIHVVNSATGIDTTDAIVQVVTTNAASVSTLTITLAAFGNANNVPMFGAGRTTDVLGDVELGYTELNDHTYATPNTSFLSGWSDALESTPSATWATLSNTVAIGIEVAATAAGGVTHKQRIAPIAQRRICGQQRCI